MGFSKTSWRTCTEDGYHLSCHFIQNNIRRKEISLIRRNEAMCLCRDSTLYDVLLEGKTSSSGNFIKRRYGGWVPKRDLFPLPYLPYREDDTLHEKFIVNEDWYFPVSSVKKELCNAVFEKTKNYIWYIIRTHYSQVRKHRYMANPLIAFTSHSPNSVAFSVFSRGSYEIINFALTTFKINPSHLNRLRLGIRARHPTEILVRRGEFQILGKLIANNGLAFKGKRIDSGLKFYISFNHILTALETGDNTLLQKALNFSCRQLTWTWKDIAREDGATPLQLALSKGRKDLIETLLIARAPVNEMGWCDCTPLQFAIDSKASEQIITLLLEHKAALNKNA